MKIKIILLLLFINLFTLNNTYAIYKENNSDKIKIYNIKIQIGKYIQNTKNPSFTAKKIKDRIEKILGKNKNEIKKIKAPYKSFKEYGLKNIYDNIKKNREGNYLFINYGYSNPHILENNYIKILVWDYKIIGESEKIYQSKKYLNNEKLYEIDNNGEGIKYINFFKIKPKEKTKEYLKNNFLNKEGKNKCELIEYQNNFNKGKSYYFGLQKKYQSEEIGPGSTICPSEFTKGHSNNGINYFQRLSSNTLIYINAGQDYTGIDFGSMEIK